MGDAAAEENAPQGLGATLRMYAFPLVALLFSLPLVVYAVISSLAWFAAPFPGFFIMENGVVPTVSGFSWPPDRQAVFHKQLVAVDGFAVRTSAEAYAYVASRPLGTEIEYTFRGAAAPTRVTLPSMRFSIGDYLETCGVLLTFGSAWLAFGLIVGFLQPRTTQGRVYLWQALIAGLYPITGIFLHQPGFPWLSKLYLVLECLFPATWIHLALAFPVERRLQGFGRLLPVVPYAISSVLIVAVLRGFYAQPPDLTPLHATYLFSALSFLFFVASLIVAYRQHIDVMIRSRIKTVLPGAILAGTLALFALTNSAVAERSFPVQFGLILSPVFSACVAYAIAKHDLFDVDRVVRLSFEYALLSIVVVAAYAMTLAATSTWFAPAIGSSQIVSVVFVLLLAFALDPLRGGIQRVVDRAFYRSRLDYRRTVTQLSAVMTTLLDLREVLAQVTSSASTAMHLESMHVGLLDGSSLSIWSRDHTGSLACQTGDPDLLLLIAALQTEPTTFQSTALLEHVADPPARQRLADWLAARGVGMLLPLTVHKHVIGLLLVGGKRSGQALGNDDVELLRTLANQTAIAVQNAQSYAALQSLTRDLDNKVRERTAELSHAYEELKAAQTQLVQSEKMASLGLLVAGVAHELNNPASFLHGSLTNLNECFAAFAEVFAIVQQTALSDAQKEQAIAEVRARSHVDYLFAQTPELLRICAEGSERIKKIVDDLRMFARADSGERVATDVREGIESTLRLLSHRIHHGGVDVQRTYGEVPRIAAHAGHLNQVWMNLLSNALDAVEGREHPLVRVDVGVCEADAQAGSSGAAATDDGLWVEVRVADNGVGVAAADRERIFEPFFTTKPIGRGTGLGLSIVFGAVKSHGGRIHVDSQVGSGTTIAVRLPVHAPVQAA